MCLAKEPKMTKYTQYFVLKAVVAESLGVCMSCYRAEITPHQGVRSVSHQYEKLCLDLCKSLFISIVELLFLFVKSVKDVAIY